MACKVVFRLIPLTFTWVALVSPSRLVSPFSLLSLYTCFDLHHSHCQKQQIVPRGQLSRLLPLFPLLTLILNEKEDELARKANMLQLECLASILHLF
jgi:hypothetical protein